MRKKQHRVIRVFPAHWSITEETVVLQIGGESVMCGISYLSARSSVLLSPSKMGTTTAGSH